MRKLKKVLIIFIFIVILANSSYAYTAFQLNKGKDSKGRTYGSGDGDRYNLINYTDVSGTNVKITYDKGSTVDFIDGNGDPAKRTHEAFNARITNPFPKEGEEISVTLELQNITRRAKIPAFKEKWEFYNRSRTCLGDSAAIGRSSTFEENISYFNNGPLKAKGNIINFTDFTVELLENNYYTEEIENENAANFAKCDTYGYTKIKIKLNENVLKVNEDKDYEIFARGTDTRIHLGKFVWKLKAWFDETTKVTSNLREVYGLNAERSAKYWKDQFRTTIRNGGLFDINEENFTHFTEGNYKTVDKISADRIRAKVDMPEQNMVFKVTALKDGECTKYLPTGQETFSVKEGEQYQVTLTNIYWLKKDNTFYFHDVWKKIADPEGNEVEDTDGQQDLLNTMNSGVTAFINLASVMAGSTRPSTIFEGVVDYIDKYTPTGDIDPADETQLLGKVNVVLSTIVDIGIVIAVIMIAVLGVKYMLGSVEEKAEYKKTLVPYVVGVVMLLGITTIVKILQTLGENINNI